MPTTFVVTPDLKAEALNTPEQMKKRGMFPEKKMSQGVISAYEETRELLQKTENGFIWTVVEAYNWHHNLVLRPDDVWLAIAIQFAFFMKAHSEELRPKFVDHEGKKELITRQVATLSTADYGRLAKDMATEIGKNIHDKELKDWIIPAFSTTEDVDRVVGSMVLMATAASYFSYKFEMCCGFPSVTLLGEVADWQEVEARAAKLANYDVKTGVLKKWLALLQPVLAQFTAAANGKPDTAFWQRVCSNHGNGSGPRYLSGWITVFSVFDEEGNWRGEKTAVPDTWQHGKFYEDKPWPIINTNDIAVGKVKVDVVVNDFGVEHKCELVAGHFSMIRVNETTIQPGVAWLIQHKGAGNKRPDY